MHSYLSLDAPLGGAHVQQRVALRLERLSDQPCPVVAPERGITDPVRAFPRGNGLCFTSFEGAETERGQRGAGSSSSSSSSNSSSNSGDGPDQRRGA